MHIMWAQLFRSHMEKKKKTKEISQTTYSFLCVTEYRSLFFLSLYLSKLYKLCTICLCYFNKKNKAKEK